MKHTVSACTGDWSKTNVVEAAGPSLPGDRAALLVGQDWRSGIAARIVVNIVVGIGAHHSAGNHINATSVSCDR